MSFWDTPTKDIPRNIVMQKRRRPVANALSFPGDELLCTKRGHETGLYGPHTKHIFVERDSATQKRIARGCHKLNCEWDPLFWRDEVWKLPLRAALENEPLEFAYLDFCAALNSRVARWIYCEFGPSLAEGARVAVTLSRNWRASKYMAWWNKEIARKNSSGRDEYRFVEDGIYSAECAGQVGDRTTYFDDSCWQSDDSFSLPQQGKSKWNQLLCPGYHDASVKVMSAFTTLLPFHDFKIESCVEYRRDITVGTYMTTFVLSDFRKRQEARLSRRLLSDLGEHVTPRLRMLAY